VRYDVRPDPRCQRGLRLDFVLAGEADVDVHALARALLADAPGPATCREERLGARHVVRLLVPFVAEVRVGERPGVISLLHRVTADEASRARSRAWVGDVLDAW